MSPLAKLPDRLAMSRATNKDGMEKRQLKFHVDPLPDDPPKPFMGQAGGIIVNRRGVSAPIGEPSY